MSQVMAKSDYSGGEKSQDSTLTGKILGSIFLFICFSSTLVPRPQNATMPKPEIEFKPVLSFPAEISADLSSRLLSADPDTGDKTVLLIHPPESAWGAPVCNHDYWEEVYIVDGRIYDRTLRQWFGAGDYCCRPPGELLQTTTIQHTFQSGLTGTLANSGMLHGPFEADKEKGCKEICWLRYPRRDEAVLKGTTVLCGL